MKSKSRRNFISALSAVTAGFYLSPSSFFSSVNNDENNRYINGWLYDLFGYPVEGVNVALVKNYRIDTEYMNIYDYESISNTITDKKGHFFFKFDTSMKNYSDIGIIFKIDDVVQPINSYRLTNTNIPFPVLEIFSSNNSKKLKEMLPAYISRGAIFYIDRSKQVIFDYFKNIGQGSGLLHQLSRTGSKSYYGNHHDPDNPDDCLGENEFEELNRCNVHWDYPQITDISRKIIIPWGKTDRRAIPFVVSEGRLYFILAQTGEDYDRIFRMIVNPAYKHISNPINALTYCNPGMVDGEMCIWFMGSKRADGSFTKSLTNIERTDNTSKLINGNMFNIPTNDICRAFIYDKENTVNFNENMTRGVSLQNKCTAQPVREPSDCKVTRTWMLGTWCSDTSHDIDGDQYNEIHPVYWIVPYFGSWERFHLSQYCILNPEMVIQPAYFSNFKQEDLLKNIKDYISVHVNADRKNYSKYVAHLHQYGLNLATEQEEKAGAGFGCSTDISAIDFWAQKQSESTLIKTLDFKLKKVAEMLTNLGNGFLLFPGMFFCYEMAELKKIKIEHSLEVSITNDSRQHVKDALHKMNSFKDIQSLKEILKKMYQFCLEGLYSKMPGNMTIIPEFYSKAAMRYISMGLYLNAANETVNSLNFIDHYNFALKNLNDGLIEPLVKLMNRRLDLFWFDAIPFARNI